MSSDRQNKFMGQNGGSVKRNTAHPTGSKSMEVSTSNTNLTKGSVPSGGFAQGMKRIGDNVTGRVGSVLKGTSSIAN